MCRGQGRGHKITLGSNAPRRKGQPNYKFIDGICIQASPGLKKISGSYSVNLPSYHMPAWLIAGIVFVGLLAVGGLLAITGVFAFMGNQPPGIAVQPTSTTIMIQGSSSSNQNPPTLVPTRPSFQIQNTSLSGLLINKLSMDVNSRSNWVSTGIDVTTGNKIIIEYISGQCNVWNSN